ncbi:MAG: hypothetical protein ACLPX8_25815 [Bryobacteraceae bacterium]
MRRHLFILMSLIPVRKSMGGAGGPAGATLYRSELHAHQWIAFVPGAGWWIFPDEVNGWCDRRVAIGLDRGLLRPVGARQAAQTGFREAIAQRRLRALGVSA